MSRIIFKQATLLDSKRPARSRMTLAIDGNRIAAIAPDGQLEIRENDRVIDLSGKTVMPGLCIGHFHVEYDGLGTLGTVNLGSERPPGVVMAYAIKNARIALHAGVTSALGTASVYDTDVCLNMAMDEKVAEGPRLVPCSPHIVATGTHFPATPWWLEAGNLGLDQGQCTGPDEFRKAVRHYIHRGVRMIKLLPSGGHGFPSTKGLRNISLDEIQAAANAAHERGAWIRAHVNYPDQILECIEAGVDLIDHADDLDDECIEAMVKHGTYYCPTIGMTIATIRWDPSKPWLDFMQYYPRDEAYIEKFGAVLRRAHKAGVKMMLGDDYGPKYGFAPDLWAREINMFVDEMGFEPLEALEIATANGAHFFGGETGALEVGKLADILVTTFDPLREGWSKLCDPETNLLAIMKDGVFVKDHLTS